MAGDELRVADKIHPGLGLEHTHRGERHRHQCRLRVLGESDFLGGALPHDRAELVGERRVDLLEHRAGAGEGRGQRLAHADRLAALPREHERSRHFAALS